MRVMLDSNLFFSYLWSPSNPNGTISRIFEAVFAGIFQLIIPAEIISEMEGALQNKSYLRDRITREQLRLFVDALAEVAAETPSQSEPWIGIVRDPKDNFLLAAAVHADVDVLVSGDKDLLDLAMRLDRPRILSPREFLDLIEP